MIIIILAAGKGNRLKKTLPNSFPYKTKSLIPIKNEPAIKRLVNQFLQRNQKDILLVLGHKYESILKVFNSPFSSNLRNKNCEESKKIKGKISYINEGTFSKTR